MCIFEECKNCKEYSTCPFLSAIVQRSYANRTLDSIFDSLNRIEVLLEKMVNGMEVKAQSSSEKTI